MSKYPELMDTAKQGKDILISISKGDTIAYRRFYEAFFQRVWNFSRYYSRSRVFCEEIVSEVFMSVWLNRERLPEIDNIEAYLFIITRNKAFNLFEKEERQPIGYNDFTCDEEQDRTNPEHILIAKELEEAIQQSIDLLPERCRIIFQMSRNEKLTHQRIAEILSISENTVHAQMVTALKKLHNSLKKYLYLLF